MDSQTSSPAVRIGFIGGGKLAGSVIRGLVRAKYCPPGEITVSEPKTLPPSLGGDLGVTGQPTTQKLARRRGILFVKPAWWRRLAISQPDRMQAVHRAGRGTRIASREKFAAPDSCAHDEYDSVIRLPRGHRVPGAPARRQDIFCAKDFGAIGVVVEVEENIPPSPARPQWPGLCYTVSKPGEAWKNGAGVGRSPNFATPRSGRLRFREQTSPEQLPNVGHAGGTTAAYLRRRKN